VSGHSQQRQIKRTKFFRQPVLLIGDARERGHTSNMKREQRRVIGQQLLIALFLFSRFGAVLFDGKIGLSLARRRSIHIITSQTSVHLRVEDRQSAHSSAQAGDMSLWDPASECGVDGSQKAIAHSNVPDDRLTLSRVGVYAANSKLH